MLDRDVNRAGDLSCETVAIVTNLKPEEADAMTLQRLVRAHWGIENQLHYVRDVTFGEDASQTRLGNGPQVMAALRNTVIGLIRSTGTHRIASALRRYAVRTQDALELLGFQWKPK